MPTADITIKRIPALFVAEVSATATSFAPTDIGPAIQPLYPQLFARVEGAGLDPPGPPIAYYDDATGGDGIVVHAAVPVAGGRGAPDGLHRTVRPTPTNG